MNIQNIHWIVVEDATQPIPIIQNLLERSGIPHTYLAIKTKPGYPSNFQYSQNIYYNTI